MNQENSLPNKVAYLVISEYKKLKKSNKPVERSNGIKEWTILAGIVAINRLSDQYTILSLATGLKAIPNQELHRSNGMIIHDCHAEILTLRCFNTMILKEIENLEKFNKSSNFIRKESVEKHYSWNSDFELALYISKLPCGDASMEQESLLNSSTLENFSEEQVSQYLDPNIKTILRGRTNFEKKGYVRTKPGRIDSDVTFSKSCSDKLCTKQIISVWNSINSQLFKDPLYLKFLVCPEISVEIENEIEKSFNRPKNTQLEDSIYTFHEMTFLRCDREFPDSRKNDEQEPCYTNAIKIFGSTFEIEQSIVNGVKNGAYTKPSKPLSKNAATFVSRRFQWTLFQSLRPEFASITYLQAKDSQKIRNKNLKYIRKLLSNDGWVKTMTDDVI